MLSNSYRQQIWLVLFLSPTLWATGCGSSVRAIPQLDLDPDTVAEEVFELYDKNGDDRLDADELKTVPALADAIDKIDNDSDGAISITELVERLALLVNSPARLAKITCTVLLDKKPLPGATVRFLPESFLGGTVASASGETGKSGNASIVITGENVPAGIEGVRAMQLGYYKVEITHPSIQIPVIYNTDTTLGCEVSPASQGGRILFSLVTK